MRTALLLLLLLLSLVACTSSSDDATSPAPDLPDVTASQLAVGPGGAVRLTGRSFSPSPSGNTVRFGTTTATVLRATATSIDVKIPAVAPGTYRVVVSALGSDSEVPVFAVTGDNSVRVEYVIERKVITDGSYSIGFIWLKRGTQPIDTLSGASTGPCASISCTENPDDVTGMRYVPIGLERTTIGAGTRIYFVTQDFFGNRSDWATSNEKAHWLRVLMGGSRIPTDSTASVDCQIQPSITFTTTI